VARRAPILSVLAIAGACVRGEPPPRRTAVAPPPVLATDRDALLVAALPVESGGVTVAYDVRGPAGITGELEVHAKAGGWRSERWALRIPGTAGEAAEITGRRVITPDLLYRDDGEAPALARASLGALADAWAEAPTSTRAAVLAHLERWTDAVADARREQPGRTREVAGTTCAVLEVGSAELCVWEAAGLPLAYRGEAFELGARRIDRAVAHPDELFAVPPDLPIAPAAAAEAPAARLERLARGDVHALAALTTPPVLAEPG
jgi:hypothetical protein